MKAISAAQIILPVVALLAFGVASGPGLEAQALDELNENGFPLEVGNRWDYRVGTDLNVIEPTLAWPTEAVLEILAREEVLGLQAFHFRTTHRFLVGPDSHQTATGDTWFSMQDDTLWGIASDMIGALDPVSAQLLKPVAQGEPDPWRIRTLVFPLAVGRSWNFGSILPELVENLTDRKVVEARETVAVPAGEFEAFRVVRLVGSPALNIRTEQWFAAIGLVKMREELTSVEERVDERGELMGESVVHSTAVMELQRYRLGGRPTAVQAESWGRLKGRSHRPHPEELDPYEQR